MTSFIVVTGPEFNAEPVIKPRLRFRVLPHALGECQHGNPLAIAKPPEPAIGTEQIRNSERLLKRPSRLRVGMNLRRIAQHNQPKRRPVRGGFVAKQP